MTNTENTSADVSANPKPFLIPNQDLCGDGYDHYRKVFRQMQRVIDAYAAENQDATNREVGVLFVKLVRYFPSPMTVDNAASIIPEVSTVPRIITHGNIYSKILHGKMKFHPEDQKRYIEELVEAAKLFGVKRDPETGKDIGQMTKTERDNLWESLFDIPPAIRSVVFPIAVARYILSNCRIQFDPDKCTAQVNNRTVNGWDLFVERYRDLILAA